MYLTFEEYQSRGGTLSAAQFAPAEFKARKRIDWLTDGRVEGMTVVPEAVKQAIMCIIRADGAVGVEAQAQTPLVASFNTDGYSESYGGPGERITALEAQLNDEVRRLLYGETDDDGVPLLYRGVN